MASRTKHTAHSTAILRFLDTEGKNIDKAFGKQPEPRPSPRSDSRPERPQGYPEEAESGLPDESEGLRAALIEYQNLEIDPRLSLDVDKCTWEDVFECMAGAEADYEQKSKGWRGVGRRLLRKAGDHAEDVDPWLKLIPPEYGMGIIGAGISIMFMVSSPQPGQLVIRECTRGVDTGSLLAMPRKPVKRSSTPSRRSQSS